LQGYYTKDSVNVCSFSCPDGTIVVKIAQIPCLLI
jgi:hypothetical protein